MPILPHRNSDGTFNTCADAFEFAYTILKIKRGSRALNHDPDMVGQRSLCGDYDRCDAISILVRAEACDPGSKRHPSFFKDWYMPEPTEPKPEWTGYEMRALVKARGEFECGLAKVGFVVHCGKRGCKWGKR